MTTATTEPCGGIPRSRESGVRQVRHLIGGEPVSSGDGQTFISFDPHDNRAFAEVSLGGPAEVDLAVRSARRAFDEQWGAATAGERATALRRLAATIEDHGPELAELEARDMGRPYADVLRIDVPRTAHNFRFFAQQAELGGAESYESETARLHVEYPPAGVVAAISPWNLPLMLATWKVAPALAFGNTVVLKPAEQAPVSCTRLAELAIEVGLPPGALNVVHGMGPESAGEALTRHPGIDRITFTGESATGRAIMAAAAERLVPLSFELGGKSPNLVFADCDLELAARETVRGVFTNSGQMCIAGSRLYVERQVYEPMLDRVCELAASLRIGDPFEPETDLGPLATSEHLERVRSFLALPENGARALLPGGSPADPELAAGNYLEPTVLADVPQDDPRMRREIFGPVLCANAFDTEEEAIALANDTDFGLAAMVFTSDGRRAQRVGSALRAGSVWLNCFFHRDLRAPFGGRGDSGIGREGGLHSREFFTEPKAVSDAY